MSPDDVHASPSVAGDGEGTIDAYDDATAVPPLVEGGGQDTDKSDAVGDLVALPRRALDEKCSKLGYFRGGSKGELAMLILEQTEEARASEGVPTESEPVETSRRMRTSRVTDEEFPGKKTAQSLFAANKNSPDPDFANWKTLVERTWGMSDGDLTGAETAPSAPGTHKLSGSRLTGQGETDKAAAVLRARLPEI